VIIREVPWDHPDAIALRKAQRDEVALRYGRPDTEPASATPTGIDIAVFLVAYDEEPIACGALRELDDTSGEIKRMYVRPDRRGTGVSTAIVRALESRALELGWTRLALETGDRLPEARRFYEREGYVRIPRFGHYIDSAHAVCYEKTLASLGSSLPRTGGELG
jgi:putative acetyltransferase